MARGRRPSTTRFASGPPPHGFAAGRIGNGRSPPQSRRPPAGIGIIALPRLAVESVNAHRAARLDLGRLRFDQLPDMADHVGVRPMYVCYPRDADTIFSSEDRRVGT